MVHPAKVDAWVTALFGGLFLLEFVIGLGSVVAALGFGRPSLSVALVIASISAAAGTLMALILWSCHSTRYEINSSSLIVRFGPFRKTLRLDAITEVFPTRNPLSAPAPSLDRLQINYRRENGMRSLALISPREKLAFVRDLAGATPNLQFSSEEPLRLYACELTEPVAATTQGFSPE
jgi:hypothetical protein